MPKALRASPRVVRVLTSHREPRSTTNPYITTLAATLRTTPGIQLRTFGFRRGLFGRYDVFHVHWPEVLLEGHRATGRMARPLLTAALLSRLTVSRIPVVRTAHNLERPEGIGWVQGRLLDWFDRLTVLRICLNERTPEVVPGPSMVILHGDYRQWFQDHPANEATPGKLLYFGLVRRYKGVPDLLRAFAELTEGEVSLAVEGKPSSDALVEELTALAAKDPRVELHLEYLDDGQVVASVTSAELVVLPYRFMHNSGALLTALSLGRPVLVPDTEVNRDLADEVGSGWVLLYTGELTGEALREALSVVRDPARAAAPDLSQRRWELAGPAHLSAYRQALRIRRKTDG